MSVAYIGIGSNIGDRFDNLQQAVFSLDLTPRCKVKRCSGIYETKPVGYDNQGLFLNAVVEVETDISPNALLGVCLGIESGMGRIRNIQNGPRNIDLDLLLYDDFKCDTPELTLPHPRMNERAFVLFPLNDLICNERFSLNGFDAESNGIFKRNDLTLNIRG